MSCVRPERRESVSSKIQKRVKKAAPLLGVAMVVFLISLPLYSQGSQGAIQGGVFDQSGAVVPGATVTITDVARGITRSLVADRAGQYVAAGLTPGTYTIRATAKGFRAVQHSDVTVEVGQTIRVDLTLQPGEENQTVTVTGEVGAVNTTDAVLGGTVSNLAVNQLPLNGRNYQRLLQLRPGVVTNPGEGAGTASTNGMRTGEDLFLIEGLSQIDPSNGSSILNSVYRTGDAASLLPIDAIQEFNTEQNPKAEYGWRAGSVVDVGVKSGTNSLHGTAYAFGRDATATDSPNYFKQEGVSAVTPATLEQFGATVGSRILKDKLFFFMGYEGLRSTLGDGSIVTIPTSVAGLGPDKSLVDACNALGGSKISPLSAQLVGLDTSTCTVTPASSSNENVLPYLDSTTSNKYLPQDVITTGPLNNGFIKMDYVPNEKQHISGMYFVSKSDQIVQYDPGQIKAAWEGSVPNDVEMYAFSWTTIPNSSWVNEFRGGYAFLNNLTTSNDVSMLTQPAWPNGYGFNSGVTNPLYGGFPEIDISGFSGYLGAGKRTGTRGPEGTFDVVDNVSHIVGNHSIKFGFEFLRTIYDNNNYNHASGKIKFTSLQNFLMGIPKNGSIFLGNANIFVRQNSFAGFIQDDWRVKPRITVNLGLRYQYTQPPVERNNYIGQFAPNLVINPATTPAVFQTGPGTPVPSMYQAYKKDFSPRVGVAWDIRGNGKTVVRAAGSVLDSLNITSEYTNPVVFGANFPSLGINNSGTDINAHTPELLALSGSDINWSIAGPVFPGNVPQVINGVTYTGLTCTPDAPCSTTGVDPHFRTPYVAEWNLDIERAITNNLSVDVAYVGNHGFALGSEADVNQPVTGAGWDSGAVSACLDPTATPLYSNCAPNTAAEVGPYSARFPYLSQVITLGNLFFSNYNALQVTVNERPTHGLLFLAGYTYSHALGQESASSISQQAFPVDAYNPRLSYGATNSDIRNRFTFSWNYEIPGIHTPAQLLQGWSASGILTLQGGIPWYPIDTANDLTGTGEVNAGGAQTWNFTGPRSAFTAGPQAIPCFGPLPGCTAFVGGQPPAACVTAATAPYSGSSQLQQLAMASLDNLGCYMQNGGILTPPAYGTVGNAGTNLFREPAYYNLDFSVDKTWRIKERLSVQFRTEFFNLFDRADFAIAPAQTDPSTGFNGGFGCACHTPDAVGGGSGINTVLGSGGPRHIQFGLKLSF
jgi:Carboxypeptidase regulatory-like domain/TonB dependent receptor-like, beta-barrel